MNWRIPTFCAKQVFVLKLFEGLSCFKPCAAKEQCDTSSWFNAVNKCSEPKYTAHFLYTLTPPCLSLAETSSQVQNASKWQIIAGRHSWCVMPPMTHTLECKLSPEAYYGSLLLNWQLSDVCVAVRRPCDLKTRKLTRDRVAASLSHHCYLIWQVKLNLMLLLLWLG